MKRLVRSFIHAGRGILFAFKNERNFQVEIGVACAIVLAMLWLPLSVTEDMLLILAMMMVLALELINTALERVMDILKPRVHPYARVVKDVTAGAVFVVSLGAAVLGIVILLPYFLQ